MNQPDLFKAGYIAIIGEPNVGKSTLLNRILDQKISAVTSKPQTTRHRIVGIRSNEHSQMIFLDTPGLLKPRYRLHEAMMKTAFSALKDADIILLILDASNKNIVKEFAQHPAYSYLTSSKKTIFLLLNKCDRIDKQEIILLLALFSREKMFHEMIPTSGLLATGIDIMLEQIRIYLPEHPPYYPLDIVSEHPERFFVSELIREKIFEQFEEEIPYSTTVEIIDFREKKGRKDLISAEIYVERDSQKGILIGRKGAALKKLGEGARKGIEEFLQRPVFLELHIKVKKEWRDNPRFLKELGYTS
jgi:GTP-binding protein Era